MLRLNTQRLREFNLRNQYITAAIIELRNARVIEVHVLAQDCAAIDAFVVDDDLILRDVIVNHHLARADDDHLAHLLRVQPAYVNVCDDLSGILKAKKDNVIDSFLHVSHALAPDRNRLRIAKPILNDADIVRGKVPERVDVGTNAAEIQPLAVDVAKVAQLAGINQFLHIADGRVIDEGVTRHHDEISLGSAPCEFIHLGDLRRQWFLDENVFTSIEDLLSEGEVTCRRGSNDHAMHARIVQNNLMVSIARLRGKFASTKARRSALESTTYLTAQPGSAEKLRRRFGPQ